jgi:hypothetical protein
MDLESKLTKIIREEIVRQYRDDERRKCPAGTPYYEEEVGPYLIARSVLSCLEEEGMVVVPREPTEAMLAAGAVAEGDGNLEAQAMSLWTAMLSASPSSASA